MIISMLASALGRRDEEPNIVLAEALVDANNKAGIKELVAQLHAKNKALRHDCIKVLYEVGERKPMLIVPYVDEFVVLLHDKDNRMQWGAMTALACLAPLQADVIYKALPQIEAAAKKGSVISMDNFIKLLVTLCSLQPYASAFAVLTEQLHDCPQNQLPMYAELALPVVNAKNKAGFLKALHGRVNDMEKESKKKRVEKVIRKVEAIK